jgi:transcriptional regulator with XRE-family HTH domain
LSRTLKFINVEQTREDIALTGMSERTFAKKNKLSISSLNSFLNNKRDPSRDSALKIAKGLDKEITEIFSL